MARFGRAVASFGLFVTNIFQQNPDLPNLLLAPEFKTILDRQTAWREVLAQQQSWGSLFQHLVRRWITLIATGAIVCRTQAQRDSGAHTYERTAGAFHTEWTEFAEASVQTSHLSLFKPKRTNDTLSVYKV